jgi:Kef-type K+ transport system membrane component KefB
VLPVQESLLERHAHGLGPRVDAELAEDVEHVACGGRLADDQLLSDAAIREALGDKAEHLELARGQRPATLARAPALVAAGSFLLPFGIGLSIAPLVRDTTAPGVEDGLAFALFLATALAVTALPVLVRILQSRGLAASRVGLVGLTAAAVEDVVAWAVLAVAGAMATGGGLDTAGVPAAAVGAFAAVALALMGATIRRHGLLGSRTVRLVIVLLASGAAVSMLGVHPAVVAFFLGVLVPRGCLRARTARALEVPMRWLLLPVFFATVGLEVEFAGGAGLPVLGIALLVLAAAMVGKLVGAAGGARLAGLPATEALTVGIMMNTRGVTGLVAILVGREAGLVPDPLFSVLVAMALVTTLLTAPLLDLVGRWPARRWAPGGGVGMTSARPFT